MHYLDTNILIYSSVNQDPAKMVLSQSIVQELFNKNKLLLSPLSLQELIFTLFKLNINAENIERIYSLFNQFCQYEIDRDIMDSAFEIASKTNFGKNINDIIHLKFAEKYCSKLLTGAKSEEDIVQKIYDWSDKKKLFTPRQILIATKALCKHGWINNKFCYDEGNLQLA